MKTNKYEYMYVLQGLYFGRWEDLTYAEKTLKGRKEIRKDKKDYQLNEKGCYRIIERRELKINSGVIK